MFRQNSHIINGKQDVCNKTLDMFTNCRIKTNIGTNRVMILLKIKCTQYGDFQVIP